MTTVEKRLTVARLARARRLIGRVEKALGGGGDTVLAEAAGEIEDAIMDTCGVPPEEGERCRDAWGMELVAFFRREPDRGDDGERLIAIIERVNAGTSRPGLHIL